MKKIKIGVSGSHGTGKSTFIKKVTDALGEKNIDFKVITDLATICPLPILHKHTVESTLWIASKGIAEEIEAEHKYSVIIADRPILDCWAYFNVVCKDRYAETNTKLQTLRSMIMHWLPTYDLIYQTVINENIPIENNKGRDLDPIYRKEIGEAMIDASRLFDIKPKHLTYENKDDELVFLLQRIEQLQ